MRRILAFFLLLLGAPALQAQQAVTSGAGHDYQPAILRAADGSLLLAFERLNASFSGDLWLSRSSDDGETWSTPAAVISSSANERHPALLQLGDGSFLLFYLKGTGASSSYRMYRATSADGQSFTEQGALNLGWVSGGEVNPHVIRHPDGTLTLSYQRLSGGSYVAQSNDNGLSWDQQKTVLAADGLLPRIAFRPADGRYLATYQVGPSPLTLYSKTTTDLRNWPAMPDLLADGADSHDSLPVLMPDGAFVVFYIAAAEAGPFDVFSRRSGDGANYEAPWPQVQSEDALEVEPHPLVGDSAGTVQLYWGRSLTSSQDYDIWRKAAVPVRDAIFRDGLESTPAGSE